MKKILCLTLIILSVFIASCTNNNNDDELFHYDFLSKEEIEASLDVYKIQVDLFNTNGSISSYIIYENNEYFYYIAGNYNYLVEKESNKIYSIDDFMEIKYLERQSTYDYQSTRDIIVDFVTAHLEIADSKYVKDEKTYNLNNIECELYSSNKTIDSKNYAIDKIYVDVASGYCIKKDVETSSLGIVVKSYWEIKELSFDENQINSEFETLMAYKEELAPLEFDKWPTEGLGAYVPEYKDGEFVLAMDEGNYAMIAYEKTSLSATKTYTNKLANHGFVNGASQTNESGQYIYLTYNQDNILLRVTFTPYNSTISIKIYQLTKEEIDQEMSKFA